MNDKNEMLIKLWELNMKIASLRFRYYEIISDNRNISLSLYGCFAKNKELFDNEVLKIMDYYVFGKEE